MILSKILYIFTWAVDLITIGDFISWCAYGQSLGSLINNPDKPLLASIATALAGVDVPALILWSASVSIIVLSTFAIYRYHVLRSKETVKYGN